MENLSSLLTALALGLIAVLLLAMLFYHRLLVLLAWLLHLCFAVGLVAASTSVLLPEPYRWGSRLWLEQLGIVQQLRDGDEVWKQIETLPARVWERVRSPFGETVEPLEPTPPPTLERLPGPLEATLLPKLVEAWSRGLRLLAFALGISLMAVGLFYRSATDLVLQLRALRRRVAVLEERLPAPDPEARREA